MSARLWSEKRRIRKSFREAIARNELPTVLPEYDVQRLHLEPGDILVLTVPGRVTMDQVDRIQQHMRLAFGDKTPKIAMLTDGMKLAVVNESELAR